MAKHGRIEDPVKATYYMPKAVVEGGKVHAKNKGMSLSALITQLLREEMKRTITVGLEFTPKDLDKVKRLAKIKRQTPSVFIKSRYNASFGD